MHEIPLHDISMSLAEPNEIPIPDKIATVANSIDEVPGEEIREQLISLINELVNKDFASLLQLLYRIDVDEKKIRLLIQKNPTEDAASIIADLIIERQLQKIESRKHFKENNDRDCEEERW